MSSHMTNDEIREVYNRLTPKYSSYYDSLTEEGKEEDFELFLNWFDNKVLPSYSFRSPRYVVENFGYNALEEEIDKIDGLNKNVL